MEKVVIIGAGESGVGAALLAQRKGFEVFVTDSNRIADTFRAELEAAGLAFEEKGHTWERVAEAQLVVKSPGIPQDAPLVQAIRQAGIPIASEIDFAARFTQAKIVAITGTNGKTTTTALVHHLLHAAGFDVAVAGNIGNSFARELALADHDYFVLEVSSFQLEDLHVFRPNVALLLNITRDHLDRYQGSIDRYAAAKFNLLSFMREGDTFIYNADDEQIAKVMNQREFKGLWAEGFSESFYQHGQLTLPRFFSPLFDEPESELPSREVYAALPLKGRHNAMNMAAAILTVMRLGLDKPTIEAGLATFQSVPHRLQWVDALNGIAFYNDSKATNVDAAAYALDAFEQPIIWIVGGVDKGNDYSLLEKLVRERVKGIICLGKDNSKLEKAFGEVVSYLAETEKMTEAVQNAYLLAEKGDVVLLSPACASFDLFENYADRGQQFVQAVEAIKAKAHKPRNLGSAQS